MSNYIINSDGIKLNKFRIECQKFFLSSADILAGHITKVDLIPAQGLNTIIVPYTIILRCNFVTTAYVGAPAFLLLNSSAPIAASSALLSMGGWAGFTLTRYVRGANPSTAVVGSTQAVENEALAFGLSVQLTVGDGTLDGWIFYHVLNVN